MGEEGKKKKAEELEAAEQENEADLPDELCSSFAIPDVVKIQLIDVASCLTEPKGPAVPVAGQEAQALAEKLGKGLGVPGCSVQWDHVAGA